MEQGRGVVGVAHALLEWATFHGPRLASEAGAHMRRELLDILACPVCRGALALTVEREEGVEVMSGSLTCQQCGEVYTIEDAIPNLLPPDLRQ